MTETTVCWKCGAAVVDEPSPWSRLAQCRSCGAELHVCRLCVHFAPRLARKCREERAEEVSSHETANFCDWFEPAVNAYLPPDPAGERAKAQLEALFGGAGQATGEALSAEEKARRELERLFG